MLVLYWLLELCLLLDMASKGSSRFLFVIFVVYFTCVYISLTLDHLLVIFYCCYRLIIFFFLNYFILVQT